MRGKVETRTIKPGIVELGIVVKEAKGGDGKDGYSRASDSKGGDGDGNVAEARGELVADTVAVRGSMDTIDVVVVDA